MPLRLSLALSIASVGLAAAPSYRLGSPIPLGKGSECRALAFDSAARRLYAAAGDEVEILDPDSGARLGTIRPTPGIRAILVDPTLGEGFTADGAADQITVFQLKTGAVARTLKSGGKQPVALAYDPEAGRLFVVNRGSAEVAALDPNTGAVVGRITLGGRLRALVSNDYGTLFVSSEDENVLHVVDTHRLASLGDDPVAPGTGPVGMGIDPAGRRIFIACANGKMPIVDADAGFVFQVLPLGTGEGHAFFDRSKEPNPDGGPPWKGRILAVSAGGSLSVLRMDAFIHYSFHDQVRIPPGARDLAFDPKRNRVFVALPHEILILQP